jgi:hypothetical protein
LPAGDPWSPYAKYTLPTALDASREPPDLPDVTALPHVRRAQRAAAQIGAAGFPRGTLFVVDLRGAASVAFGTALSRASAAHVSLVPTFNNWPDPDEMVPAEETLAAMTTWSPAEGAVDGRTTPVFLLDAWRLAYRFEDPGEGAYDNRYILNPSDLPDAATLRQRGVDRVLYVVEDREDSDVEEDDLHACFLRWQAAGISLAMVDLSELEVPFPPTPPLASGRWFRIFDEDALVVRPRSTIVDAPSFYARARGGFGGLAAQPVSVQIGGIWFDGPSRHGDDPDGLRADGSLGGMAWGFGGYGRGWGGAGGWGGGGG